MRYDPIIPLVIGGAILAIVALIVGLALLTITWEQWVKQGKDDLKDGRAIVYWGVIVSVVVASTGFLGTWTHG